MLSLIESVCRYIPIFPCKCGRHRKETHKSVVKKVSSATAGSVKKLGTARGSEQALLPQRQFTVTAGALGLEPGDWGLNLGLITYRLISSGKPHIGPSSHICEMGITMVPLD